MNWLVPLLFTIVYLTITVYSYYITRGEKNNKTLLFVSLFLTTVFSILTWVDYYNVLGYTKF